MTTKTRPLNDHINDQHLDLSLIYLLKSHTIALVYNRKVIWSISSHGHFWFLSYRMIPWMDVAQRTLLPYLVKIWKWTINWPIPSKTSLNILRMSSYMILNPWKRLIRRISCHEADSRFIIILYHFRSFYAFTEISIFSVLVNLMVSNFQHLIILYITTFVQSFRVNWQFF